MAVEIKSKQIGDCTYRVRQLPAVQGRKVLVRLMKMFGPALGSMESNGNAEGNVLQMLSTALENLDEDMFDSLCDTFAKYTEFELPNGNYIGLGEQGMFDQHFTGKMGQMTQWLVFCVQVNFADFLGVLSGAVKKSAPPAPTTSSS